MHWLPVTGRWVIPPPGIQQSEWPQTCLCHLQVRRTGEHEPREGTHPLPTATRPLCSRSSGDHTASPCHANFPSASSCDAKPRVSCRTQGQVESFPVTWDVTKTASSHARMLLLRPSGAPHPPTAHVQGETAPRLMRLPCPSEAHVYPKQAEIPETGSAGRPGSLEFCQALRVSGWLLCPPCPAQQEGGWHP